MPALSSARFAALRAAGDPAAGLAGAPAPVREAVAGVARRVLASADAEQARAALALG